MDRAADLRADYDALGVLLMTESDGSRAAALVRERRILGGVLEGLESASEVPLVDQLAERRSQATASGPSSRRRKSG